MAPIDDYTQQAENLLKLEERFKPQAVRGLSARTDNFSQADVDKVTRGLIIKALGTRVDNPEAEYEKLAAARGRVDTQKSFEQGFADRSNSLLTTAQKTIPNLMLGAGTSGVGNFVGQAVAGTVSDSLIDRLNKLVYESTSNNDSTLGALTDIGKVVGREALRLPVSPTLREYVGDPANLIDDPRENYKYRLPDDSVNSITENAVNNVVGGLVGEGVGRAAKGGVGALSDFFKRSDISTKLQSMLSAAKQEELYRAFELNKELGKPTEEVIFDVLGDKNTREALESSTGFNIDVNSLAEAAKGSKNFEDLLSKVNTQLNDQAQARLALAGDRTADTSESVYSRFADSIPSSGTSPLVQGAAGEEIGAFSRALPANDIASIADILKSRTAAGQAAFDEKSLAKFQQKPNDNVIAGFKRAYSALTDSLPSDIRAFDEPISQTIGNQKLVKNIQEQVDALRSPFMNDVAESGGEGLRVGVGRYGTNVGGVSIGSSGSSRAVQAASPNIAVTEQRMMDLLKTIGDTDNLKRFSERTIQDLGDTPQVRRLLEDLPYNHSNKYIDNVKNIPGDAIANFVGANKVGGAVAALGKGLATYANIGKDVSIVDNAQAEAQGQAVEQIRRGLLPQHISVSDEGISMVEEKLIEKAYEMQSDPEFVGILDQQLAKLAAARREGDVRMLEQAYDGIKKTLPEVFVQTYDSETGEKTSWGTNGKIFQPEEQDQYIQYLKRKVEREYGSSIEGRRRARAVSLMQRSKFNSGDPVMLMDDGLNNIIRSDKVVTDPSIEALTSAVGNVVPITSSKKFVDEKNKMLSAKEDDKKREYPY